MPETGWTVLPDEEEDRIPLESEVSALSGGSGWEVLPDDNAEGSQKWEVLPGTDLPSQRAEIMAELDENPFARKLTMQMLDTEGGGTATLEALVNRTAMIRQKVPGWKISDELTSGFYGPINSGYAQTRDLDPDSISQYQKHIDEVRAGSNVIQGRTDQGYPGDPNSSGPGRVLVPDNPKEIYNYWTGRRRGVDFSHEDSAKFAMQLEGEGPTLAPSTQQERGAANRQRLAGAIADAEKAGYKVPHFIGTPGEPEGDRSPTIDMENLVSALKKQEESVSDQTKKSAIAKERAYWEDQIKTSGMSAEQWRKQTGEPDPALPEKKEVGLIESAKRGVMSSSIGIGEAVNRYAYSPVVHGISEAVQAVAPGTEVAKKAKEFDDAFFKHTVEEPAQMRKKLEFDPETEERTAFGGRTLFGMDIGKGVDVAGELSELGGALVPDIATAALTQGATAAKAIPKVFETAAPTILNAIKSYAPQLTQGARAFMLPAMKSGMDAAKLAKEQGASEVDQNAAFLTNTLKTMAMASVPMATESRLATLPARLASRGAQGGALAGATGELERTGSNIVLGEDRPFSPVESLKQGVTGGVLGGAMGRKGAPARKLQQAKAGQGAGIGITAPGTGKFAKAFPAMTAIGKRLHQISTGIKPWTDFKKGLLGWHARAQRNTQEVKRLHKTIVTEVPDVTRRDGITNYIQANGDLNTLQRWEAATSNLKLKQGYQAAQNLNASELAVVKTVQDTYKDLLKRARHYGIDMNEVQNYVTQMWDLSASGVTTNPTTFSSYFKFAKPRTFTSFFEGEQAGLKPKTKDIAQIIATYTDEMNNAINNRMFVEEMGAGKGTDGRPLLHPAGLFYTAEKSDGGKTYLSLPDSAKVEAKDYEFIDRPALKKWMWKGQDDAGNPFFQKSDMLIHPEVATQLKRAISGSGLRKWYRGESRDPITALGKGTLKFLLDEVQPTAKATMLSFSPFHLVQEGIHGFGHTVNPLSNIPRIDLPRNAGQMDAARHGLVLGPTRANQLDFMDGVGMDTKNLVTRGMRKFGGLKGKAGADFLDGTTHWLFEVYIPGLKYKTYEHILERNSKRFADDLKSGKVNIDQIKSLSAEQANAAYGHLNYADLGRSPNLQHFFQIAFLAPDFFEARARFVGQSARALVGQKGGMEQFRALAVLAATQWIGARIFNTLNNDDPLWEYPFEVKVGNKLYGVRSVPEDLFRLAHDQRAFISGRISPVFGKAVQEGLFGINWRGEQVSELEAIKDIVFGIIPLPFQTLTRDFYQSGKGMTISPMEQLWAASGVRIHRFSPITEIHRLSGEWQEKHAPQTVTRVAYPISKYAQLRYALEDGDKMKAQHEFQKLRKEGGLTFDKVAKGFEASIKMPFTGSLPNDARFYQSLNYKDKAKFKAAMERRSTIINRFRAWVSPSDKDAVTEAALMSRMLDAQANDEL